MRADRSVGEVEVLADLAIGHPAGGHRRDLQLLRSQVVAGEWDPPAARLAAGAELLSRTLPPVCRAEGVEPVASRSEGTAGVGVAPLSPQPRPVCEQQACAGERP